YRLNVISIQIPPLRERKEDIPLLVHRFIEKFNIELGKRVEKISEEALKTLMKYDWPGNVRELENVIERAMVITKGTLIKPEDIQISAEPSKEIRVEGEDRSLRAVERAHIQRVLEENDWNIQRSAQILGIDRVTLYKKIKKYGLKRKEEET
ncbi:MAG: sigma-54-dependent Fis family transcriptional regulator, partial [Deltaproteobacteria bacterium]